MPVREQSCQQAESKQVISKSFLLPYLYLGFQQEVWSKLKVCIQASISSQSICSYFKLRKNPAQVCPPCLHFSYSRNSEVDNQKQPSMLGCAFLVEAKDGRDEIDSDTQSLKFVAELLCHFHPLQNTVPKTRECCYSVCGLLSNLQPLFIITNNLK